VYASDRGDFVRTMAKAWLKADPRDKRIIMSDWSAIVVKYDLDKEVEG